MQPAAPALTAMQVGGTYASLIGSDLLVQGEQVRWDVAHDLITLTPDLGLLIGELAPQVIHQRKQRATIDLQPIALGHQGRHRGLRSLDTLHDLQLHVLEVRLSAGE